MFDAGSSISDFCRHDLKQMLWETPARWIRVSEAESSLGRTCPWLNIPWNGGRCPPSLCSGGHLEGSGWAPAIQTHTLHLNSLHPAPGDFSQGSSGTFCPSTACLGHDSFGESPSLSRNYLPTRRHNSAWLSSFWASTEQVTKCLRATVLIFQKPNIECHFLFTLHDSENTIFLSQVQYGTNFLNVVSFMTSFT